MRDFADVALVEHDRPPRLSANQIVLRVDVLDGDVESGGADQRFGGDGQALAWLVWNCSYGGEVGVEHETDWWILVDNATMFVKKQGYGPQNILSQFGAGRGGCAGCDVGKA